MQAITRGWHLYIRGSTYWLSFPFRRGTKRETTRTRDPIIAEAVLLQRRREIEGGKPITDDGRPKLYASDGSVHSLYTSDGSRPASFPDPIVALADDVIAKAKVLDMDGAALYGVRLACAVRGHSRPVSADSSSRRTNASVLGGS